MFFQFGIYPFPSTETALSKASNSLNPEKAMAPHSSTLAWKIPWTEEPGGPKSMGSHRVGHDWSDLAAAAAAISNYGFNLCFSNDWCHWTSFHVLICHHYIFLVEYLLKSFAQLFIGLFSYSWVLRILCIFGYKSFFRYLQLVFSAVVVICNWFSHSL